MGDIVVTLELNCITNTIVKTPMEVGGGTTAIYELIEYGFNQDS